MGAYFAMITITVHQDGAGAYQGFTCIGHAGYGKRGRDIVCAAVSVLAINTVNAMETLAGASLTIQEDEESGLLRCLFQEPPGDGSILLMDAFVLGIRQMMQEYGRKYITLQFKEV